MLRIIVATRVYCTHMLYAPSCNIYKSISLLIYLGLTHNKSLCVQTGMSL